MTAVPVGRAEPTVLIGSERIQSRVCELADEIARDLGDVGEVILVGVLKGAFVFLADLARVLDIPHVVDFIAVSSYGQGTTTSGDVRLVLDVRTPVVDRPVLLVEDIVDSGYTLEYLQRVFAARGPSMLKTCTLLRKPGRQKVPVDVEYVGFEIPDVWVVGYGLDLADRYRTLPYIGRIDPDAAQRAMSELTIDFIERLVLRHPRLKPIFEEHVSDNFGEVLPHLFFGDLTRYVVSRFIEREPTTRSERVDDEVELRHLLNDLEDAYAAGDKEIQELISVSFLENLPRPGEEASGVRAWLGPELSAQLRVIG